LAHSELVTEIILPEDRDIWKNHGHGIEPGIEATPSHIHFRVQDKDGPIRWIAHVCQPVFNDHGDYDGVPASNRDITNLRMAEREAREYRETLAQLDRTATLGQLAVSLAHELNQPLTGILSKAQAGELLLQQGNDDTIEIREILTDVIADAKRSAEVIRIYHR
jgi:signal transduction histidine kinase